MKQIWIFLLFFLPFAFADSFTSNTFDGAISVGGIYNIDAYAPNPLNSTIPCIAYFKDKYNNTIKTETSDSGYNAIRMDNSGYVKSYIKTDDRFLVGENYTFYLSCANYTASRNVFIDVPGDFQVNTFLANIGSYSISHPDQFYWGIGLSVIGLFILIGIVAYIYSEVKHR
jgi:hypothetical protein